MLTNTLTIMENNFCIFIISHGRPNDIITLKTLNKAGCTLPTFIVIDNEDKAATEYWEKYQNQLHVFDKKHYASLVDQYDNLNNLRTTTHARNFCFDLAEKLGYEYFLVLDDDYGQFKMRINSKLEHPNGKFLIIKNINNVFLKTLEYFKSSNFASICYSQGGDWFGGETNFNKKPKRKAMNSFFCSTKRRFWFVSRLNEDVNTYMALGKKGLVFLTIPFIQIDQQQTQKTKGGMTEAYCDGGTYVKSFYTILDRPDCTEINLMGRTNNRMHHLISWKNAAPVIIKEKHKKL